MLRASLGIYFYHKKMAYEKFLWPAQLFHRFNRRTAKFFIFSSGLMRVCIHIHSRKLLHFNRYVAPPTFCFGGHYVSTEEMALAANDKPTRPETRLTPASALLIRGSRNLIPKRQISLPYFWWNSEFRVSQTPRAAPLSN